MASASDGTPLVLGIDIGTASSKGVLADPDGTVVAVATRPHALSVPRPGRAEHDADGVWWLDVLALCGELLRDGRGRRVQAVCVSGVGPCVLLCDAQLRPLHPAILYGVDTRATAEIAELEAALGAEAIVARGGSPLSSQAAGPKLLWLARNEPGVWRDAAGWYMPSSFAVARLTGEYVLDHHSASQSNPLYDLAARDWAAEWADVVAPGLALPRLAWPGEIVGAVTATAAEATGLPAGTPVCAGTIDAWAEAFSVGVRRPGDLMLMYGSTMFFILVTEAPERHPSLWTTAGIEPGTSSLAGGMATSGSLTGWLRDLAGAPSWETLTAEAAGVPAGARGLLMLPYFAGERTPILDPDARGVLAGLTLAHGRPELARAVYEATAFGVRHNVETLRAAAGGCDRAVAVGGGAGSTFWPQLVSDVAGIAQALPAEVVGASYGDALLAATAAGLVPPGTDWTRIDRVLAPDPDAAPGYDELFARYRALYDATRDTVHWLARQR